MPTDEMSQWLAFTSSGMPITEFHHICNPYEEYYLVRLEPLTVAPLKWSYDLKWHAPVVYRPRNGVPDSLKVDAIAQVSQPLAQQIKLLLEGAK